MVIIKLLWYTSKQEKISVEGPLNSSCLKLWTKGNRWSSFHCLTEFVIYMGKTSVKTRALHSEAARLAGERLWWDTQCPVFSLSLSVSLSLLLLNSIVCASSPILLSLELCCYLLCIFKFHTCKKLFFICPLHSDWLYPKWWSLVLCTLMQIALFCSFLELRGIYIYR